MKYIPSILFILCVAYCCSTTIAQSIPTAVDAENFSIQPYVFHSGLTDCSDTADDGTIVNIKANLGQNIIFVANDDDDDTVGQGFWYMWYYAYSYKPPLPKPPKFHGDTLYQNFPNPFNPTTSIPFYISPQVHGTRGVQAQMFLTTELGEHVKSLINSTYTAGNYSLMLDGRLLVFPGMYFCTLVLDDNEGPRPIHEEFTIKLLYLK